MVGAHGVEYAHHETAHDFAHSMLLCMRVTVSAACLSVALHTYLQAVEAPLILEQHVSNDLITVYSAPNLCAMRHALVVCDFAIVNITIK